MAAIRVLDKEEYQMIIWDNFPSVSTKMYVMDTHLNRLIKAILVSTLTYIFGEKNYPLNTLCSYDRFDCCFQINSIIIN